MAMRDIVGQDRAVHILLKTVRRERIPSSYLFAGESGIGKKFTAINLAKTLNCLTPAVVPLTQLRNEGADLVSGVGGGIDACDECSSCRKIDSGVHPDLLIISPEGDQIKIEEIRAINDVLSLKAFEGRYKVVIVDDAETMNQFAANAFLKTLEEPPRDSLIILISSNPDRLPDTIRSRCSRVNFTPLPHEACGKVLKKINSREKTKSQKLKREAETANDDFRLQTLIRLSMGRPGIVSSENLIEEREWFMKLLTGMINAEKDGWASRDEMERWVDLMLILLRDMALLKNNCEANLINIDMKEHINKMSSPMDIQVIIENFQKLSALKGYFHYNLNKSLTWNLTGSLLRSTMGNRHV